jgi:D-beta-D-heptose 7-phosphate kinase/D-beta-D-heptose 1-phosphate adenosyltransferase
MQRLTGTFSRLVPTKVLVIGDVILDSYTVGKARRISPEAPVAVLEVHHEEHRAGGAGNVALNLVSLAADVVLVGRIGEDSAGELLKKALSDEGVQTFGLVVEKHYKTPVKNRIIADNQQIVRIDHEQISSVSEEFEQQVIKSLPKLMEGIQVIAISDYGKGFLSVALLDAVINLAKNMNIPVVVDPKGINFAKYSGATLIKPNKGEAYAAANQPSDASLEVVAKRLLEITDAEVLMITRSESGISLFYKNGTSENYPVRVREVKDVTGAGDTVLAMLAVSIACGLDMTHAVQLCNLAAGIAIERFGCARISLPDLARRLLEFDFINKVFDEEHLFALQEALKDRKITLLGLSGENGLTTAIFSAIKKLTLTPGFDLIIYIRDVEPDKEFVNILASLQNVNFIILNTYSLKNLCNQIEPDAVYLLNGNQLQQLQHSTHLYSPIESPT